MYEYIKGILKRKGEGYIVVDNEGMGYRIHLVKRTLESLTLGEEVLFFIHYHVKEDERGLYGFQNEYDRDVFELLLSVPGVGLKMGMRIFEERMPLDVIKLIYHENVLELRKVKGMGEKLAQKMILELKGKLANYLFGRDLGEQETNPETIFSRELREALQALGYRETEINKVVSELDLKGRNIEEAIKFSLVHLSKFK